MTIRPDHSVQHLEREAAATRARLTGDLDHLVEGLTPGRLFDEALAYSRRGGANFLRGLGHAAAANPIPTLLIGAGCAMFLSGRGRPGNDAEGRREVAPKSEWERSIERAAGTKQGHAMSGLKAGAASAASTLSSALGEG